MSSYAQLTERVGDDVLAVFKTFEAVSTSTAAAVSAATSKLAPSATWPTSDKLPKSNEVVAANFALAGRVLQAQRDLVVGVVGALVGEPAVEKASTTKR